MRTSQDNLDLRVRKTHDDRLYTVCLFCSKFGVFFLPLHIVLTTVLFFVVVVFWGFFVVVLRIILFVLVIVVTF